jgi:hypothetical protein
MLTLFLNSMGVGLAGVDAKISHIFVDWKH